MNEQHKAALEAAGIDWRKIDWSKVASLVQLLIQILLANQPNPPVQSHRADGACDHESCCLETLKSALQTAHLAAEHYQHCCQAKA